MYCRVAGASGRHLNVGSQTPRSAAAGVVGASKDSSAGHRGPGSGQRDRAAAEVSDQAVAKAAVEHDVDDEVDGGVDGQHCVGDLADRLHQVAVRFGVAEVQRGHDGIRDDADDEYDDDDHQHDRDAPAHRHLPVVDAHARPAAQRGDDGDSGEDKDDDGDDGAQETLRPVVGDDERVVAPQLGEVDVGVPRPIAVADADGPVSQSRRNGDQRHHEHHGAGYGA